LKLIKLEDILVGLPAHCKFQMLAYFFNLD
jgi:hypothetical protein